MADVVREMRNVNKHAFDIKLKCHKRFCVVKTWVFYQIFECATVYYLL